MIPQEIINKFELKETDFVNGYFENGTDNKGYLITDDTVLFCSTKDRIVFDHNIIDIYRTIGNYRTKAKVSVDFLKQVSKEELILFINNRLVMPSITPQQLR